MSLYTDLRATAGALLQEFGQPATLNKRTASPYDPDSGTVTQTAQQYPVSVLVNTDMESRKAEAMTASATLEQVISLLIDASTLPAGVVITSGDTLQVPALGATFKVVDPGPIAPGGINVIYQALVKA